MMMELPMLVLPVMLVLLALNYGTRSMYEPRADSDYWDAQERRLFAGLPLDADVRIDWRLCPTGKLERLLGVYSGKELGVPIAAELARRGAGLTAGGSLDLDLRDLYLPALEHLLQEVEPCELEGSDVQELVRILAKYR